MKSVQKKGLLFLLISAAAAVGDQLLKAWIVANVELGGEYPLLPGILRLTYLRNTGAAHSLFRGMRWGLVIISSACAVGILLYLLFAKANVWAQLGLSLVLGGAVGNLIDRVRLGYVVDLFETEFIVYPVFNIADCCIVVGGILFCIVLLFFSGEKPEQKKRPAVFPETGKLRREHPDTQWTETGLLEDFDLQKQMEKTDDEPEEKQ